MKTMKKILAAGALLACVAAYAIGIYDRATVTLGTTTGAANWTNGFTYAAIELKRIWVLSDAAVTGTNTVTINRIMGDSTTTTQTVGSVAYVGSALSTASFTASYLRSGDILQFTSGTATNGSVQIEFEVQQR